MKDTPEEVFVEFLQKARAHDEIVGRTVPADWAAYDYFVWIVKTTFNNADVKRKCPDQSDAMLQWLETNRGRALQLIDQVYFSSPAVGAS